MKKYTLDFLAELLERSIEEEQARDETAWAITDLSLSLTLLDSKGFQGRKKVKNVV